MKEPHAIKTRCSTGNTQGAAALLAATALLLVAPLESQVTGSINRDAPVVTDTIKLRDGSELRIRYTAIRFGEGRWRTILRNTANHARFNSLAARQPIGSIMTNVVVTASGRKIPAGEYDLFFTAFSRNEQSLWVLNLIDKRGKIKPLQWGMVMTDTPTHHKRMRISLAPLEDTRRCSLSIAFGKQAVHIPVDIAQRRTDFDTARDQARSLYETVQIYYLKNNRLPDSWSDLRKLDERGRRYIESAKNPTDPWGNEFEIRKGAKPTMFEVISWGPDGIPDTKDDVSSRVEKQR